MSKAKVNKTEKEEVAFILNPAVFTYRDASYFLELCRKGLKSKKVLAMKNRSVYARVSIVLYHSTIEALLNYLLYMHCFPEISDSSKKFLERLPYESKILEITKQVSKKGIGIKGTKLFTDLVELQELRNSFIHPKLLKYTGKVQEIISDSVVTLEMDMRTSQFPSSGLDKSFMNLDYRDARITRRIVDAFLKWLRTNMKHSIELTSLMKTRGIRLPVGNIKSLQILVNGRGEDLFDMVAHKTFSKKFHR